MTSDVKFLHTLFFKVFKSYFVKKYTKINYTINIANTKKVLIWSEKSITQPFTCLKLTIETLEQGVKYVRRSIVSIVNFEQVNIGRGKG